jgi:transposase
MMENRPRIVLGIDTHLDVHVAAAITTLGHALDTRSIPTSARGYRDLLHWARELGEIEKVGIEGTGSYGADLTRLLVEEGLQVIEVNRPDRARRRRLGKNDPTDAENAARAVLSGEARAIPKAQNGPVEAMRMLIVARRSAVKARTQASNQLKSLLIGAPDPIRTAVEGLSFPAAVARCARFRPSATADLLQASRRALRALARRWIALGEELRELDQALAELTARAAPRLRAQHGIGPQTAATLLITAGDNPERLHSEAALAALCGVSPLEASSGRVVRHRLNRGGNRQANNALWTIALVRARGEPRTQAYVARRTSEGRTLKEIFRCLKRYIVREIYPLVLADLKEAQALALT